MKINRVALIRACWRAENENRKRYETAKAKHADNWAQQVSTWRDAYAEQWMDAALKVRKILRAGGVVTADMLPKHREYRDVAVCRRRETVIPYEPLREVAALRKVLETVQDDVVTIGALERLGLQRATIRSAVQHLEAATIEGTDN